jgi:hypothetical protein
MMVGRSLARVLVALGLLCASIAWTGWVVLQTLADPERSSRIAHAVLDDPEARDQLAADLARSLAGAVNTATGSAGATAGLKAPKIDGNDPTLRAAVATALADPRLATNVIDALAAEHANLLGVEPKQPAEIDTAILVETVGRAIGAANPALAARITAAAPASIPLPDIEIPFVASIRNFAITAVPRLAVLAVLLCGAALLVGDRAVVLRRAGGWAVGAGLLWVIGPRVVVWLAERFAPGHAAVVRAVLRGATGVVTATATLLAAAGVGLIVLSLCTGRFRWLTDTVGSASVHRSNIDARGVDPRLRPRVRHWANPTRRDDSWSPGWRSFTGRDLPPPPRAPSDPGSRFDGRV